MTEGATLPDLSAIREGQEVTAYYYSQRSGNEVSRTGTVTAAYSFEDEDDRDDLVRMHVEQRECFKHSYVALIEAEWKSGGDGVAAYSMTLEAERPNGSDPPNLGTTYTVRYECSRKSFLGKVNRVVREDGPGPYLVTDGGKRR